jgi:hypothetical protein
MQSISAANGREAVWKKRKRRLIIVGIFVVVVCVGGGWLDAYVLRASSTGSIFVKFPILKIDHTDCKIKRVSVTNVAQTPKKAFRSRRNKGNKKGNGR